MSKNLSLKELVTAEDLDEKIKDLSFENGLQLLEELVEKVESGGLPLDKAILSYERGVVLIEKLRSQLTKAEEKLQVLQKSSSS